MGTFPEDWPNDCPPADSADASGVFFRVVKQAPCSPDDFLTQGELGKARSACPCLRAGLSLLVDIDSARNYMDKYPHLGELIASGAIGPEHGKIRVTGGAHVTWWSYSGVIRHSLFAVVI